MPKARSVTLIGFQEIWMFEKMYYFRIKKGKGKVFPAKPFLLSWLLAFTSHFHLLLGDFVNFKQLLFAMLFLFLKFFF